MTTFARPNWSHHVDQILRSRHYTWIGEGLGGAPLEEAMVSIVADLMHMCHRSGMSWDELVDQGQQLCEQEEHESTEATHAA